MDEIYVGDSWGSTLPVEMTALSSFIKGRDVTLYWSVNDEINNSHFEIERTQSGGSWNRIGSVAGSGTSSLPRDYSFTDRGLESGTYFYRLKQIDFNGNFEYFNLRNEVSIGIPIKYNLSQNYPNPFNPVTRINFDLPLSGNISLKLFDISGKEIATLAEGFKAAGYYGLGFDASGISSGIYFYSLNANGISLTKRMLLVK